MPGTPLEVSAEDIVILTPRAQHRANFKHGTSLGQFELVKGRSTAARSIQVASVYRFKGLEKKVVILTEIDQYAGGDHGAILYVGSTRAQTHLVVRLGE